MSKELIKKLNRLVLDGTKINENELKNLGLDTSKDAQIIGNLRITNDFWSGFSIKPEDNLKDLDGVLICENKKFISRVKNLLENGINKISISEFSNYNIWKPAKELIIGNIKLREASDILFTHDYYEILINDKAKNMDGLWLDSEISTERILKVLSSFELSADVLLKMKELDLNKELEFHFKKHFETVKKGGRSNQGDIDLILGSNHNYGIELKLARELTKASSSQKAIGQIEMYTRQFNGNFMLLVAGENSEKNDKAVAEVVRKAKDCNSSYFFIEAS